MSEAHGEAVSEPRCPARTYSYAPSTFWTVSFQRLRPWSSSHGPHVQEASSQLVGGNAVTYWTKVSVQPTPPFSVSAR